jgi:hypothetical protein
MITLIQEAGRRRFYLDLGYGTLFAYLTEGLKYSAAAAMRRIESARIANDIPQVKEKVLDGTLTISNLARAQQFFKQEAKASHALNLEEKKEVLKMLEGQSSRDAERTLASLSSQPVQMASVEQIKPLTQEHSKISFLADQDFMDQLEEAKGLLASKIPGASVSEIMAEVMKLGLSVLRKKRFKLRDDQSENTRELKQESEARINSANLRDTQVSAKSESESKIAKPILENKTDLRTESTSDAGNQNISMPNPTSYPSQYLNSNSEPTLESNTERSRYIPASVQRQVRLRDGNKCIRINPKTGKRCESQYDIEFDHHPIPFAEGGDHSVGNLRLLCRSCNVLHGVGKYGRKKMTESYREMK